jgi:hypothetical protein
MNELDSRLAAWNPVRAEDLFDAAAAAEADDLLNRLLAQQISKPARHQSVAPWRRPIQAWIAATAAVAIAATAIAAAVLSLPDHPVLSLPDHRGAHAVRPEPPVIGFRQGSSQGLATSAIELVDYATRAAAMTPVFVPRPRDWEYFEVLYGRTNRAAGIGDAQTWQQVGTSRNASRWHHGRLTFGYGGGPGARLIGWPTDWTNVYQYLASLPTRPAALRKLILANNHHSTSSAFNAIGALLFDFPLSARFQAELYAVLISLPGVHFSRHATDAAKRHGVGLYMVREGYLNAMIINPRTYVYMGGLTTAVRGHVSYQTLLTQRRPGAIVEDSAILASGIVERAGQVPNHS